MLDGLKTMFGIGPKVDLKEQVLNGGIIIDVRTPAEFKGGHVKNSKNIPLSDLPSRLPKVNKETPIITCCASGMRSASAKSMLKQAGFSNVYNGGGWESLQSKLN